MRSRVNSLAGTWVCPLLLCAGLATAAGPDLRLVDAVAGQDADAARALLHEGIDVDAARADGVTALLWAAHWDDLGTAGLLLSAGADVTREGTRRQPAETREAARSVRKGGAKRESARRRGCAAAAQPCPAKPADRRTDRFLPLRTP